MFCDPILASYIYLYIYIYIYLHNLLVLTRKVQSSLKKKLQTQIRPRGRQRLEERLDEYDLFFSSFLRNSWTSKSILHASAVFNIFSFFSFCSCSFCCFFFVASSSSSSSSSCHQSFCDTLEQHSFATCQYLCKASGDHNFDVIKGGLCELLVHTAQIARWQVSESNETAHRGLRRELHFS